LSKLKPRTIEVEIYDQKYSIVVKAPLEEDKVRELAGEIDKLMREVSEAANTADSLKVAILTALHFAHEYRELRHKCDEKTAEWSRALEEVLKK